MGRQMKTILVVEDEMKIARLVRDYLEHAGFDVDRGRRRRRALASVRGRSRTSSSWTSGLPGRDGLDVTRELRRTSNVPIVMLTARGDEADRIVGLELGADDYVVKPFSPKELVARVRAVLRRTERPRGRAVPRSSAPATSRSTCRRMRVTVGGRAVELTPTEFQLLADARPGARPRLHAVPAPGRGPRRRVRVLRARDRRAREEHPQEDRARAGTSRATCSPSTASATGSPMPESIRPRPGPARRRTGPPLVAGERAVPAAGAAAGGRCRGGSCAGWRWSPPSSSCSHGSWRARLASALVSGALGGVGPRRDCRSRRRACSVVILLVVGLARGRTRRSARGRARRRRDGGGRPRRRRRLRRPGAASAAPASSRRLARSFNAMTERLEASEEQRRNLLADVAHELRTPLSVIQGNAEGMLDGLYPADRAHLEPLLEETRVMSRLLDDLQTLSTAEAGALRLHRRAVEPADLVEDAVGGVRAAGRRRRRARWSRARAPGSPRSTPTRSGSARSCRTCSPNALRHTPSGGSVSVSAEPRGATPSRSRSPTPARGSPRRCSPTSSTGS